jgi:hypothetical protein
VTTAPDALVAATVIGPGTVIAGGVVLSTVTVNPALDMLLAASPAVQVTVVVPMGNVLPEGGPHAKVVTAT